MKVCAIIAEYNPFHSGHARQIELAKRQSGCDYCLVILSGDFVQRGAPAIIEKYTRARAALSAGADLVLMLPLSGSTASAEGFARTGIAAGLATGLVDAISFGCEDVSICGENYRQLAARLNDEDANFRRRLRSGLSAGMPYPKARVAAIQSCYGNDCDLTPLEQPNNLLAFEYLRAMSAFGAGWEVCPVKRTGSYHDTSGSDGFASASAVRRILLADGRDGLERLKNEGQIPEAAAGIFREYMAHTPLLQEDDFSEMLHYALLIGQAAGFADYPDCGADLSARICNSLPDFDRFSGFCDRLKNKSVSRARISRVLTHILLNQKEPTDTLISPAGTLPYLRVLGFRKSAGPLLHELKLRTHAPIVTRVPEAFQVLDGAGLAHFRRDLLGAELYRSRANTYPDDCRRKVEIW